MSRAWVIIKRTFKYLKFAVICLIIAICIFMIWRISSTGAPKTVKYIMPNEKLCTLYAEKGEDMYMFRQNYDNITRTEERYGYFAIPDVVFIPDANQAQILFRYNNSTVHSVASDYELTEAPDRSLDMFDVTLMLYIDLTPDNEEDNYSKVNEDGTPNENIRTMRFQPSDAVCDRTTLYNFYRYTFDLVADDGTSLSELLDDKRLIAIHTEFYYNGDINYEENPFAALSIYDSRRDNIQVKLSGKDKKALEN